jgi:lysylphosphatidylglycerol synthetase-like protein (DUF2156 family)
MKDISLTGAVAPIDASRTRENASTASGVPLPIRIALMREHGRGSYAFSAVYQSGLEHFGDERGFLAYKKVGRTALVLSDPVAPPENLPDLISRFVAQQRDVGFWFVSHGVAKVLAEQGFTINAMGYDTHIDLPTYSFSGRKKQTLREALNRMVKRGFVTREGSLTEVGIDKVKALHEAWRQTRTFTSEELVFLNRPLLVAEEPDVRRFFTFDKDGKLVAFAFFDPIYDGGKVIGYLSQHSQNLPEADRLVTLALKRVAIETFQKEGLKLLHLGLAPFADIMNDQEFRANRSRVTAFYFHFSFNNWLVNRYLISLKGIVAHRRLYDGIQQQTYYAFNRRPSLPRIVKLMRACKMI